MGRTTQLHHGRADGHVDGDPLVHLMNPLADSLRRELQGLETVLHRLTTLRLMMATGTQRSIERAASELDEALVVLGVAESTRVEALRHHGFAAVADAIAASEEPLRSDLTLTRTRLERTRREVRGAALATSTPASRSLSMVQTVPREPWHREEHPEALPSAP